jgi:renalase
VNSLYDVLIVGAGVSGLTAAREFSLRGLRVAILEKSRGLGGRLSTRRWGDEKNPALADTGAQFTSLRNPEWAALLENHPELSTPPTDETGGEPRRIHPLGMSRLARTLLTGGRNAPTIVLGTRVVRLQAPINSEPHWKIVADSKIDSPEIFLARDVVLTAPVPQTIELLDSQGPPELHTLHYSRCLAVIAMAPADEPFRGKSILEFTDPESSRLTGIYDQRAKGLLSARSTVVVHASPNLSQELWEEPPAEAAKKIWAYAKIDSPVVETLDLHRWKFAQAKNHFPEPYVLTSVGRGRIGICGDAFIPGGIEGAFASATALARRMVP